MVHSKSHLWSHSLLFEVFLGPLKVGCSRESDVCSLKAELCPDREQYLHKNSTRHKWAFCFTDYSSFKDFPKVFLCSNLVVKRIRPPCRWQTWPGCCVSVKTHWWSGRPGTRPLRSAAGRWRWGPRWRNSSGRLYWTAQADCPPWVPPLMERRMRVFKEKWVSLKRGVIFFICVFGSHSLCFF